MTRGSAGELAGTTRRQDGVASLISFGGHASVQSQTKFIRRPLPNTVRFAHLPTQCLRLNLRRMDFLKSAVASAISQGPPFPYTFGDKVDVDESIWTLYNGTRRVSLAAENWACITYTG